MVKPFIMAIAGGSGCGKTTIVNLISQQFTDKSILVFAQDHYYRDLSHLPVAERDRVNFDHPDQLDTELMFQHMQALARGQTIKRPSYDFATHTRSRETTTVDPAPIIIFDGIFSLYYAAIRNLCDLKLYVDVCDDLRFIRRLKRDMRERGRQMDSVVQQYLDTVRPMHQKYVEPSKVHADLIVCWEKRNQHIVPMLASFLRADPTVKR